jgi:hypothetical protein
MVAGMSSTNPSVLLVFDEDIPDAVWDAVQAHNALGIDPIDAVMVGKHPPLPKGTKDARLLEWAEQAGRVIISRDRNTMTAEYNQRLSAGGHSAGVLIIAPTAMEDLIEHLALVAHATTPADWFDRIDYFP